MDFENRLEDSYYATIAVLNEEHGTYLVQHRETGKIYVRKVLDVYNLDIYESLRDDPVPGVPRIVNLCEEDGRLAIIEEFISGETLREKIDAGALSEDQVIRYMTELCAILERLHGQDPPIIHRDIKPSNVIVTPCDHVFLIDFDAAKRFSGDESRDTVLLGTKGYAAPEQYGFGASSPRTDIYALGILLRELAIALPGRTGAFDGIIKKCTEMNPSDRTKTVRELRLDLEALQAGGNGAGGDARHAWRRLLPPGFRTGTPWKMLVAVPAYLLIFYLFLTLDSEGPAPYKWTERVMGLLMMLSVVFCTFDYCGVQRIIPICASRNALIRCLGILALNLLVLCALLLAMFLIELFIPL